MNVAELIQATDKLSPAERADFEREWLLRWHPEYEQRRQEVGKLLREGVEAARRGEIIEGTPENLDRIYQRAMATAASRQRKPEAVCPG